MKNADKDPLQKDIKQRIDVEKKNKPKKVAPKKKHPLETIIGLFFFIIVLSNLIYLISSMLLK
ncbi:hypothetical protein AYR57_07150 [Pediococcus claussenii]|nr:hypothetical protein AYR57_07150 [Pediococcus claussenii]ANZ71923.1 hypothetical protein AYR58_07150 [Pediococcus claussenii]